MKFIFVLLIGLISQAAFAGLDCIGTTVVINDDGISANTEIKLKRIHKDRDIAVYFAESTVFKFWVEHEIKEKLVSLEIRDRNDITVVNNPKMKLARFNVSTASYWKNYFTSLNCTPTQN